MNLFKRLKSMAQLCAIASWVSACGTPAPVHGQFAVELAVHGDDGSAVAGAALARGKQPLGMTDAEGHLRLRIAGPEGEPVSLSLKCPEGFAEPKTPLSLRLATTRRVGSKTAEPLKLEAMCPRKTRELVVVVHAPGGQALPIRINGEDAGATDPDGDAHVLLGADRGLKALDVELDTSARRDLVPQNPRKLFALNGRDAILLLEQSFTTRRTALPAFKGRTPRRHVPTRID